MDIAVSMKNSMDGTQALVNHLKEIKTVQQLVDLCDKKGMVTPFNNCYIHRLNMTSVGGICHLLLTDLGKTKQNTSPLFQQESAYSNTMSGLKNGAKFRLIHIRRPMCCL